MAEAKGIVQRGRREVEAEDKREMNTTQTEVNYIRMRVEATLKYERGSREAGIVDPEHAANTIGQRDKWFGRN